MIEEKGHGWAASAHPALLFEKCAAKFFSISFYFMKVQDVQLKSAASTECAAKKVQLEPIATIRHKSPMKLNG